MGKAGAGGAIGIVGLIVYLLISQLGGGAAGETFGVDSGFPSDVPAAQDAQGIPAAQDPERDLRDFSAYVFSDAQDSWEKIFAGSNRGYERAQVVLYRKAVSIGCGSASSAVGPFTARPTSACTSTSPSTRTWSAGWGRTATSRGPT